jgi:hypothetical protein
VTPHVRELASLPREEQPTVSVTSGCDAEFSGIDEPKLRDVTRTLRNVQDTLRSRGIVTRDTVRASSVVAPLSPPRVASTPERTTKIRRRGRDPVDATTAPRPESSERVSLASPVVVSG